MIGAKRQCLHPGCRRIQREARCEEHASAEAARRAEKYPQGYRRNDTRPAPAERGYDSAWRAVRAARLALNPACQRCGATDRLMVHHRLPIRTHPELRLDLNNTEALCGRCHSRHTASDPETKRKPK